VSATYLDQHIYQPAQVLVVLVALALGNLEQLGDVEEQLTLLVVGEELALVEQEDALVEDADALLLLQGLVVEHVTLLHQRRLRQVRVCVLVLCRILKMMSLESLNVVYLPLESSFWFCRGPDLLSFEPNSLIPNLPIGINKYNLL
jgi:hypothetical protein